jgi:hypothetical protein
VNLLTKSGVNESVHFVVDDSETVTVRCSADRGVRWLIIREFSVAVIWSWKAAITAVTFIAAIANAQIKAPSKWRPIAWVIINRILRLGYARFFLTVQQYEARSARRIIRVWTWRLPLWGCEGEDSFAEFCADDCESVFDAIALFVELGSRKAVFWRSENEFSPD